MKNFRQILVSFLLIAFLTSCSTGGKKLGDVGSDPNVEVSDLTFQPKGSDAGFKGLSTINFPFDSSELTSEGRAVLEKNSNWIKSNPRYVVEIEGHCDNRGSVQYNIALGEKRANTVKEYLMNLGVSSDSLTIISYGKERLINPNSSEAAHLRNRRANFNPIRK